MVYVNIFRDQKGGLHYSTEEFSLKRDAIATDAQALADAWNLTRDGAWEYKGTLSDDHATTVKIKTRLRHITAACARVGFSDGLSAEEIERLAEYSGL